MRCTLVPCGLWQSPDGYLHAPDAPAGGTAQPTASEAPASASPSSPTSPSPGSDPKTPASPTAGTIPPASATTRSADDWTPPTREKWEGVERSRRALAARAQELDRDLKAERQRVAALAGVTPQRPEDVHRAEVVAAFNEMFPHLQIFQNPKVMERFMGLLERGDELSQASEHVWDGLTRRTVDRISDAYAEELNLNPEDIDDEMRANLTALFSRSMMADPDAFRKRYEREDPTLVTEFIAKLRKGFFEPARRAEANRMVRGQPRVPSSGPGRPVVSVPPQIDFSSRDAAENAAVEYLKARGHLRGSGETA